MTNTSAILVTGASGFIGSAVMQRLSQELGRSKVIALNRRKPIPPPAPRVQSFVLENFDSIHEATDFFKNIGVVVHLAARVHVMTETVTDPLTEFRRVNVQGMLKLARQAALAGVKRFVLMSSVKVNGEFTQPGEKFTETDTAHPQDAYALSKHEAEQGLQQLAQQTGMEVVIIRPPLVYGLGAKANFAALVRAVKRGWPLPLGAVNNQRSLVSLDNLVDFILTCTDHPAAANQTFLVSDGQDLSTTELIKGIAQAASVSARLLPVPVWALQAGASVLGKREMVQRLCGNLQLDISKARNLLAWNPPVSVEEGLRRAVP